ncbi:MAG: Cell envelope-related transcriptional attenuator [Microgenomates group bacterium GW2011_GWC2_45_8]|nr:MAG: Cell envelope-related transcriptional attenuator [Microgenomates group bacterium GW2011_GWC2_45_8]
MSKFNRFLLLACAGLFLLVAFWQYYRGEQSGQVVTGITQNPEGNLRTDAGRTNVVFLGVGGDSHPGGDLTDSMIIFSYSHATRALTLVPLPRDIWVPSLAAKINTAYHYGGIPLTKSTTSELVGLPIHYAVTLDFQGFERMIDAVGGIDVEVKRTLDDYLYPIPGQETAEPESARYEHLHFESGPLHLDGATALKFARSRHAVGEEGTDFARSTRQEQVIVAFKNKLLSSSTLLSLSTLQSLFGNLQNSLVTDMNNLEIGAFIRIFLDYSKGDTPSRSLDLTGLFVSPKSTAPYSGQWVLIPKTSQGDIHTYVAKNLAQ